MLENPPASAGDAGDGNSVPGRGSDNPLQYSCLGDSTDRSLVGYSPWGPNESDTAERLSIHTYMHTRYERLTEGVLL